MVFNMDEVRKHLKSNGFPADILIQNFWRIDSYDTVLNHKVFVDHLITFVKGRGGNTDFTKFEFYKYYFDQLIGVNESYRKKLWELALVLETQQKNELKSVEFQGIVEKVGLSKQELMKANLLVEKDDKVGFFHHTITEFLVAEKWIKEGKVKESLTKLLVKEAGAISPINFLWYGVIRFLLDSDDSWNETYGWLWNEVTDNPSIIDEGFADTITSIDPGRLDVERKSDLFGCMFDTYVKKRVWIPLWTRVALPNFCELKNYEGLKELVTSTKEVDPDFLTTIGNVLDIVSRLMENESELVNSEEKNWWRDRLVGFADCDSENGVVQRHALSALSNYKGDLSLIEEVNGDLLKHESNLVREAYLDFCSDIDPNGEVGIDRLVKGLTEAGEAIYSRYGLYKISNRQGMLIFLKRLAENEVFLKLFLDKESIFNGRDRNGDEVLIERIQEFIDDEMVGILKSIIKKSLETKGVCNQERSYFLRSLTSVVTSVDQKYIDEILANLEGADGDKAMRVYDYIPYFVWVLNPDNVEKIYKRLVGIGDKSGRFGQQAIHTARFEGDWGKNAYEKAVKLGIVTRVGERDWGLEQSRRVYMQFRRYLGSEVTKTYFPAVFEYFHQNIKIISAHKNWKVDQKRLRRLIVEEGLKKIDPKKFELTITKGEDGRRTNHYSISSTASYFGDVIKTAKLLDIPLELKARQNIIDYIPFAYTSDCQAILEAVGKLSDGELDWVNSQYLRSGDIKYFLPDSYVYIARLATENSWGLSTPKKVLVSIATDVGIPDHNRKYALETLEGYISKTDSDLEDWLRSDFGNEKTQKSADDLLISVFKDRGAIESRIRQIKDFAEKARDFKQPQGVHSVGDVEEELIRMHLAKPLFNLGLEMYAIKILGLLEVSADILDLFGKDNTPPTVEYLWNIVFGYIDALNHEYSMPVLKLIDSWVRSNSEVKGLNWIQTNFEKTGRSVSQRLAQDPVPEPVSIVRTSMPEDRSNSGNNNYYFQQQYINISDSKVDNSNIGSSGSTVIKVTKKLV